MYYKRSLKETKLEQKEEMEKVVLWVYPFQNKVVLSMNSSKVNSDIEEFEATLARQKPKRVISEVCNFYHTLF